ncbi:Piso0_000163 [Millerozyma farinosa CBS 7064]|uniref:Piso0_000163 protein n=1 Tax=Pichia sorbitophila (strain ATCC MYA-4447 / BCRC 22081 / CBS 7064 / NBRC 10061 / NRRL Y-12695) TaxID=559304 RepID=G8YUP5_PICSO|nr:Piso0_000163 [Millerozyma farinosa CBS 7064]
MDVFNSALKNPLPPSIKKEESRVDMSDASIKKKNSRRKHRNSHLGCGTCKKRRIKCDETLPACINCLKGKLHCAYLNLDANARNALRMAQYNQNVRQEKSEDDAVPGGVVGPDPSVHPPHQPSHLPVPAQEGVPGGPYPVPYSIVQPHGQMAQPPYVPYVSYHAMPYAGVANVAVHPPPMGQPISQPVMSSMPQHVPQSYNMPPSHPMAHNMGPMSYTHSSHISSPMVPPNGPLYYPQQSIYHNPAAPSPSQQQSRNPSQSSVSSLHGPITPGAGSVPGDYHPQTSGSLSPSNMHSVALPPLNNSSRKSSTVSPVLPPLKKIEVAADDRDAMSRRQSSSSAMMEPKVSNLLS